MTEANQPPQLAAIPDQSVREGSEFTYPLAATDSDLPVQNLTYSLSVRAEGLTVSSVAVLTWRPTLAQAGRSYPVTAFVIDENGGKAQRSFAVTVQVRRALAARWIGATDGDWNNPANWDIGRVPNNSATEVFAVFPAAHPVTIRVAGNINIQSFNWEGGETPLLAAPSVSLNVQGDLWWTDGTLVGEGQMAVHLPTQPGNRHRL